MILKDVLKQYKNYIYLEDSQKYNQLTISNEGEVSHRDTKFGSEIGRKRQFIIDLKENPYTLIFTRQGVVNGSIGIVPRELDGYIATENMPMFSIDTNQIDTQYLLMYLKSKQYLKQLFKIIPSGTAQKALHEDKWLLLNIELPDLMIQKQIVSNFKLKKIELDNVFEEINKQKEYVTDIRQSILQQAVEGKLCEQNSDDEPASVLLKKIKKEKDKLVREGKIKKQKDLLPISDEEKPFELPNGWEWCRLGELTEKIGAGSTPTGGRNIYSTQGVKFIRSQNVYNSGLVLNDVAYISSEINKKMRGSIVKPNDILLNITGGSIGRCALVSQDFDIGNINQHILIIRTVDSAISKYLHYILISKYIQNEIMSQQVGVSREGFSAAKATNLIISLPPLSEQHRIVEKVDSLMQLCDDLEKEVDTAQQYASQLMESVLQEAFSTDKPIAEEQSKQKCKVIPIQPKQETELHFAMAARGNIKQSTLESLQKRAIEIANGEK